MDWGFFLVSFPPLFVLYLRETMIMPSHGCCVCLQEMCTFNLVQSELSNVLLEKYPPVIGIWELFLDYLNKPLMGIFLITMKHLKVCTLWATILTLHNATSPKKNEYSGTSANVKIGVEFYHSWSQPLCLYQCLAVLAVDVDVDVLPSLPTITPCQWLDLS